MDTMVPMMASPFRSFPRLLAACALTLSVAACSTSGQNASTDGGTATTAVASDPSTTTGSGDPVPSPSTTEATSGPREVTVADLETILPTAREVGGSYDIDDSGGDNDSSSDPASDAAFETACPGASDLFESDVDDDEESAEVSMQDGDNRVFEVTLDPVPDPVFDEDSIDQLVDAINGCDTVIFTDDDGWDFTIDLEVERDDAFGDVGVLMSMEVTLDRSELDAPLEIGYTLRSFLVDTVTVSVSASDGIDDVTYETIPRDDTIVEEYAEVMETRVIDLLAG